MAAKVLLVVIDAATPHVVCPAIRTGRLPILQRLAEAGGMHESSVSIFPSITPAATSSIATGAYPAEHGIAGASWFDTARNEIAYYGDDFWVIAREGFGSFIDDFLVRLNGDRLKAPTMFQMIERTGRTAACLNYLVFKGDQVHDVRVPDLLAAVPGVPLRETVHGPSLLALGDFVGPGILPGQKLDKKGGVLHRFGMDDASTGAMLCDLMGQGELPDFTIAYFADNDYQSHKIGPFASLPVIDRIDRMLGEAFEAAGGIDRVLADTVVIVTSDHGHCDELADPARAVIRLDTLLANFRQARLGESWRVRDEVMLCPNMRAAQIYVREPSPHLIERIAAEVLEDPRVDQAMWRTELTRPGAAGYTVSSQRGRLTFAATSRGRSGCDVFGGAWEWSGDPGAVMLEEDGRMLLFSDYPNAFERIAGALELEQSGEIWVTAKAGCEFEVPGGSAHVGGASHGALHVLDSLSPVIIAGGGVSQALPRHMRLVDIAPLCMGLLGVPMRYGLGDARRPPTSRRSPRG
jgi:predicted AlkP superfamily pyrophosphatase or phosphodiesterase